MQLGKLLLFLLGCLGMACSKDPRILAPQDSWLAYYNATQQDLSHSLVGIGDMLSPDDGLYNYLRNQKGNQQFGPPSSYGSSSTFPWMGYAHRTPGMQSVGFYDADTVQFASFSVETKANTATIVFLSDSLGVYQTFASTFGYGPLSTLHPREAVLQVVNLCPDAGPLAVSLNGSEQPALPYRAQIEEQRYTLSDTQADTLVQVRARATGSAANEVLVSTSIRPHGGQRSVVVIYGYSAEASYTDPRSGQPVTVPPLLKASQFRTR